MPDNSPQHASGVIQGEVLIVTIMVDKIRDSAPAYALRDEIISLVDATRPRSIVLDMQQVDFIGSVGLLAFLGVRRHVPGGRIVLCNMSDPIRQMFAVCRLIPADSGSTAPFEVESTVATAVARLAT